MVNGRRGSVLFFINWLVFVLTILIYDLIIVQSQGGDLIAMEGGSALSVNGLFVAIGLVGLSVKFLTRNLYFRIIGTILLAFGLLGFVGLANPFLESVSAFFRVVFSATLVVLVHYLYSFLQSYRWKREPQLTRPRESETRPCSQ